MLALALAALIQATDASEDLKHGEELFAAYKWADARRALTRARAQKGLTRDQLLRILELSGVAAAQQRQPAAAQAAFTELLTLDPQRKLEADYAPRVMTPFYEARRVVQERGALTVAATAEASTEQIEALTVRVTSDPMKSARAVRFHLGSQSSVVPLSAGSARLQVGGSEVSWSAELLGDNEAELWKLETRLERPPPPVVTAPPPPTPAPEGVSDVPPSLVEQEHSTSGARVASYVVLVTAVAAGGVGGFFGWRSGDAFSRLAHLSPDSSGRVVSITERDAYALQGQGTQSALAANSLYIAAGVLALAAVLLFLVGR
jgi:hypothetical protein